MITKYVNRTESTDTSTKRHQIGRRHQHVHERVSVSPYVTEFHIQRQYKHFLNTVRTNLKCYGFDYLPFWQRKTGESSKTQKRRSTITCCYAAERGRAGAGSEIGKGVGWGRWGTALLNTKNPPDFWYSKFPDNPSLYVSRLFSFWLQKNKQMKFISKIVETERGERAPEGMGITPQNTYVPIPDFGTPDQNGVLKIGLLYFQNGVLFWMEILPPPPPTGEWACLPSSPVSARFVGKCIHESERWT